MFSILRSPLPLSTDWASLILRLTFGGLMATNHGWSKFLSYSEQSAGFPDPLGVGAPTSMALTIFGELVCGILIALGLFTRLAIIPASIAMVVAIVSIHWDQPFGEKEHALLYLMAYAAIYWLGSGRYSLDAMLNKSAAPTRLSVNTAR